MQLFHNKYIRYLRRLLSLVAEQFEESGDSMSTEYALYKGDELLSIGTIKELAEEFRVGERTIHFYMTPTYKKRTNESKARRLVKLD